MSADITSLMGQVSEAAKPFESRWTLRALQRVDAELYLLLVEQQGLYHEALVTGSPAEAREQAAAMCRGWAAATRRMEQSGAEDDAYLLGLHPTTGTKVAIGSAKHAIDRVRQVHGEAVIWMTPDEVAAMVGGLESLKGVQAVKNLWPDAEVIRLHRDEPAQDDAA